MGMIVGTGNPNFKTINITNPDGAISGTISISQASPKKKKRLNYNFKEISSQILNAQTSVNARKVLAKAHGKVAMLRQILRNSEYDSKELESALAHALKMEKAARKRMKHLQQEETIERQSGGVTIDPDSIEEETGQEEDISEQDPPRLSGEELKRRMRECERLLEETIEESGEMLENGGMLNDMEEACQGTMEPEDLERLKKKHRAKEWKEIMEADLQYLKALFDRLAKEKQEISSGAAHVGGSGVALELNGIEMPVQAEEVPVVTEGGGVDIMV